MVGRSRVHPAWIVLGALTLCIVAASGIRAAFGIYIKPLEREFGWSRGALSGAAAMSLLLLGAAGPFLGRLADRWGAQRVIAACLVLLGAGALATAYVQSLWQIYVTMGLMMAIGAGGLAMTTAASIIARWFEARRGLAFGIAGAAMSAGQLLIIPLTTGLTLAYGWRTSYLWLGALVLVVALPVALAFIHNEPEERGLRPYGATGATQTSAQIAAEHRANRVSVFEAARVPQFWLLMGTFFVCGYTSAGMILTHFVPHALDHNFTEIQAATALRLMGSM